MVVDPSKGRLLGWWTGWMWLVGAVELLHGHRSKARDQLNYEGERTVRRLTTHRAACTLQCTLKQGNLKALSTECSKNLKHLTALCTECTVHH